MVAYSIVSGCLLGRDSREMNHTEYLYSVVHNAGGCVRRVFASASETVLLHSFIGDRDLLMRVIKE